jgi:hypothetical protein
MTLVKKSSFFMECLPGQKRSTGMGGKFSGGRKDYSSTWYALDEVSVRVFLFLSIPLIIIWIVMCSWGGSRCNCRSSGVTFLPLAPVGEGRNSGRCWEVGGVGVVVLSDERTDKLIIGGEEMET